MFRERATLQGVPGQLIQRFQSARRDPQLVVLEGLHAIKHALRFGAEVQELATCDPAGLALLARDLAPEAAGALAGARVLSPAELAQTVPRVPRTQVVALATRPQYPLVDDLRARVGVPLVALEDPRRLGNLGACVRVSAAAGAAGVISTGAADPWHPEAVRGAAGLQFALPTARVGLAGDGAQGAAIALRELANATQRRLIALDPEGDELDPFALGGGPILLFGTERDGISPEALAVADERVRLPMRDGVSSLNLATSVAATLYAWRFASIG